MFSIIQLFDWKLEKHEWFNLFHIKQNGMCAYKNKLIHHSFVACHSSSRTKEKKKKDENKKNFLYEQEIWKKK